MGEVPSSPKAAAWFRHARRTGIQTCKGFWTNATITPFEQPSELGGKQFLRPEEASALEKQVVQTRVDRAPPPGDPKHASQSAVLPPLRAGRATRSGGEAHALPRGFHRRQQRRLRR
jgi:hypothetical protein